MNNDKLWCKIVMQNGRIRDLDLHFHQSISPLSEGNLVDLDLGVLSVSPLCQHTFFFVGNTFSRNLFFNSFGLWSRRHALLWPSFPFLGFDWRKLTRKGLSQSLQETWPLGMIVRGNFLVLHHLTSGVLHICLVLTSNKIQGKVKCSSLSPLAIATMGMTT